MGLVHWPMGAYTSLGRKLQTCILKLAGPHNDGEGLAVQSEPLSQNVWSGAKLAIPESFADQHDGLAPISSSPSANRRPITGLTRAAQGSLKI